MMPPVLCSLDAWCVRVGVGCVGMGVGWVVSGFQTLLCVGGRALVQLCVSAYVWALVLLCHTGTNLLSLCGTNLLSLLGKPMQSD